MESEALYQYSVHYEINFEIVQIPYEGTYLKGYFYGSFDYGKKEATSRPTLLFIGGYDSTLQELYFCGAAPAIDYLETRNDIDKEKILSLPAEQK